MAEVCFSFRGFCLHYGCLTPVVESWLCCGSILVSCSVAKTIISCYTWAVVYLV